MNEIKTPFLTIKNLTAWYNPERKILSDFSLKIKEHETVGLVGLNGAGKTTFFKILSGLLSSFYADDILLNGHPAKFREKAFKTCRYVVFAEDNSFQYFTFREYFAYVCAAYRQKLPDTAALIQGFHFEKYTDVLLKDLSTGNKKKAFLITAFALQPRLLLLDEPVNGLDFQSTEFLYQLIAGYKMYGTVLFSSHILESVTLTADRILVLEDGHIRQTFTGGKASPADIREALSL